MALRAQWHANAALAPRACLSTVPGLGLNFTSDEPPPSSACAVSSPVPTLDLFTVRFDGTITAPAAGSWEFRVVTNGGMRMWIDDHILVDSSCDAPSSGASYYKALVGGCGGWDVPDLASHGLVTFAGRDNVTHHIERGLHLRLEWLHYGGGPASLRVLWRPGTPSSTAASAG